MVEKLRISKVIAILKQLNTTSLRLIPYLENNADYDGLITVHKYTIVDKGLMARQSVSSALNGLIKIDWIHLNCEKEQIFLNHKVDYEKGFCCIDFNKYFEEIIKSLHKPQLLLFYYCLLSEVPGEWYTIAIEKLYNKSLGGDILLSESFANFMSKFIPLIEKGLIEVKLGSSAIVLTEESPNVKKQIYDVYGKSKISTRKKQLGESDVHPIQVHISKRILKDKEKIHTNRFHVTMRDFEKIALGYSWGLHTDDLMESIYSVKYKIYCNYGNQGIKIYRNSLKAFFEDKECGWEFHDLVEKREFLKVFLDRFFVPRIIQEELG